MANILMKVLTDEQLCSSDVAPVEEILRNNVYMRLVTVRHSEDLRVSTETDGADATFAAP